MLENDLEAARRETSSAREELEHEATQVALMEQVSSGIRGEVEEQMDAGLGRMHSYQTGIIIVSYIAMQSPNKFEKASDS